MMKQVPEDMPRVNFLISLLVQFPEIFTIYYNVAVTRLKITFMLKKTLEKGEYIGFQKLFQQCQDVYNKLKENEDAAPKLERTSIESWTLLEATWEKEGISLEEISLACSLVLSHFQSDVFIDLSRETYPISSTSKDEESYYECLLSRKNGGEQEENLFAFRDSGKVYVFDR